jgi:hypothetical protein
MPYVAVEWIPFCLVFGGPQLKPRPEDGLAWSRSQFASVSPGSTVTSRLEARILEQAEICIAGLLHGKYAMALLSEYSLLHNGWKSRDCSNSYTRNNRETVVGGVFLCGQSQYWGTEFETIQEPGPPGCESLKIETVNYSHEFRGARTLEGLRWRGPAATVNYRSNLSSEMNLYINKPATV